MQYSGETVSLTKKRHKHNTKPTSPDQQSTTTKTVHCNVQVHKPHDNLLMPGQQGLLPCDPWKCTWQLLLLTSTGKRIIRDRWMILPMPAEVIVTEHQLAMACKK